MIHYMYQSYGIIGSIILVYVVLILGVLWITGLKNITQNRNANTYGVVIYFLSVIIPLIPIGWQVYIIIQEYMAYRDQ